jgi:alkyl hydroperoxide reductase subunit AhpC
VAFHAWKAGRWAVLFSCPFAFTPVCTTELIALAGRFGDFEARQVKVAVLAADHLDKLQAWATDVERLGGQAPAYPLIADSRRHIAALYGMVQVDDPGLLPVAPGRWLKPTADFGIRTMFVISPANKVALTLSYPPNVGLSFDEVLRTVDSLQMSRHKLATPADWRGGEDMVVGRVIPDSLAQARFGPIRTVTPYLRFVPQPSFERWRG